MRKKTIALYLYALIVLSCVASAQGPGFDEDVVDAPIDGGVTLILAAAGYAVKKIADKNK